MKKTKLPRDPAQRAKMIADIAIGDKIIPFTKQPAYMTVLGRKGGLIGGPARAKALTKAQRKEIARNAANTRWGNKTN
jgi:hypothetical protein